MAEAAKPKRADFPGTQEGLREYQRVYRLATHKAYRTANKSQIAAQQKSWRDRNKSYYRAYQLKRSKRMYGGAAVGQHWDEMNLIYMEAARKTLETGVPYSVDHIWPLNGKNSCGLHVPWNLRVITQAENDSKGNKEPL